MLEKAPTLGADALLLDLEDAVPPDGKDAARDRVLGWLASTRCDAARLVRVNPADTPWGDPDLEAVLPARPDGLVIPKVTDGAALAALDRRMGEIETAAGIEAGTTPIVAIATETPRAILRLEEIAEGPRIAGLTWGAEDLSAVLGAAHTRGPEGRYLPVFELARNLSLIAAHAAGVAAIDGVYTDFRDTAGLEREAAEAAASGFTGKLTIHPSQIAAVNAAFTPSAKAIASARALLAAWEEHSAAGRGAFAFEGEMVDAPHLARARALLERARD